MADEIRFQTAATPGAALANGEPGWASTNKYLYVGQGGVSYLIGAPLTAFGVTMNAAADAAAGRTLLAAAPLASPTFTGVPAAPTAAGGTNTTQIATTAFVRAEVAAGGTVTSVGLAAPAQLTVSGSPVTSSGTLTLDWATQTANKVFAGPSSGGPATPAFRLLSVLDLPAHTQAASTIGNGFVDDTEFDFLNGVTSAIQTQLDAKQPLDADLTAIAGLTSAADKLPYFTGSGTAAVTTFTAFGRSLTDDADAAAGRTTLGVVIGTDVQAFDAELSSIAGLTSAADRLPYFTGSGTAALATYTTFARSLDDDADATTALATLEAIQNRNLLFPLTWRASGAAIVNTPTALMSFCHYIHHGTATGTDYIESSFMARDGAYTLTVLCETAADRGIHEVKIDGVDQGDIDYYSAATTRNVQRTLAVTVVGNTKHTIRFTANSRHASSSNYYRTPTAVWIWPTSAE